MDIHGLLDKMVEAADYVDTVVDDDPSEYYLYDRDLRQAQASLQAASARVDVAMYQLTLKAMGVTGQTRKEVPDSPVELLGFSFVKEAPEGDQS